MAGQAEAEAQAQYEADMAGQAEAEAQAQYEADMADKPKQKLRLKKNFIPPTITSQKIIKRFNN